MQRILFPLLVLLSVAGAKAAEPRIVSVGGAVTETIFALGAGDQIVGVDTSSIYPEEANKLPKIGYIRMLSAEGVASLHPDVVILGGGAGPKDAIEQLKALDITLLELDETHSVEAAKERITKIGEALDRKEKAAELVAAIDAKFAERPDLSKEAKPKVLFVLSPGGGSPLVAGKGTAAAAMIELAGGQNAVSEFEGYKPISAEALAVLEPDVLLTTERTLKSLGEGGLEKSLPGFSQTPAGNGNKVIAMDDLYLLGFGPRVADAIIELAAVLSPSEEASESAPPVSSDEEVAPTPDAADTADAASADAETAAPAN